MLAYSRLGGSEEKEEDFIREEKGGSLLSLIQTLTERDERKRVRRREREREEIIVGEGNVLLFFATLSSNLHFILS